MNLTATEKALKLTRDAEARAGCQRAWELENIGDFEGARVALSGLWTVIGQRPMVEGLSEDVQAQLLLRVGSLSGCIGASQQIGDAQEFAKDLIGESIRRFDLLGDHEKAAEAETDLAICYLRAGAMDEARVCFGDALRRASTPANKVRIFVNSAVVEIFSDEIHEALNLLEDAGALLDKVDDHATKGRYYMQLAIVYKRIGSPESLDRALIENAAASFHLEMAGHTSNLARVENNIGFIQLQLKRYDEAIEHLDRARHIFRDLKDTGSVAQVNETRARVFLSQQRYEDAEHAAIAAVKTLEHGGEQSLLAEALTTYGTVLARTKDFAAANSTLMRATSIAETAGDPASSARARLVMIEELQQFLPAAQMLTLYLEADERTGASPDSDTITRFRSAARTTLNVLRNANSPRADAFLADCSFKEAVRRYEADLITSALNQADGQLTRAARLLGMTHQGLGEILKSRHKELRKTPPRRRRRSIIKKW